MLRPHVIRTNNQKVLGVLAKFSDQEFYERQLARKACQIPSAISDSLGDMRISIFNR